MGRLRSHPFGSPRSSFTPSPQRRLPRYASPGRAAEWARWFCLAVWLVAVWLVAGGMRGEGIVPGSPAPVASRLALHSSPLDTPGAPAIKLQTSQAGLHRVSAAALAGLLHENLAALQDRVRAGQFVLLHRGEPVTYLPDPGSGDLLFYAQRLHNNFTETNVYWLKSGTNGPVAAVDGSVAVAAPNTCWRCRLDFEKDLEARYELGTHPDSNYWFWAQVTGIPSRNRNQFEQTVDLPAVAAIDATNRVSIWLQGLSETNYTLTLAVNGLTNTAWRTTWSGKQAVQCAFDLPASALASGTNTLRFTLATLGVQLWVDRFQVDYARRYTALNGQADGWSDANTVVTLPGFSSPKIKVLDLSTPTQPVWITNLLLETESGSWRASFRPRAPNTHYLAFEPGVVWPEPELTAVWPSGLTNPTNRARYVVVASPALASAAQALVDYRQAQGLPARLVWLDALYDEFNWGFPEPEAIRSFLQYAWSQWQTPPDYLLLAGNGSYDYRNLLARTDNLVPPLMVPTLFGLAASDSLYGDIAPNPGPELAVGRLPALTPSQLTAMIDKIKAYEASPPAAVPPTLLIADSPAPAGDFVADIADVQKLLAGSFQTAVVFPTNTSLMREQIRSTWGAGVELVCYLGHGASDRLGSDGYLTSADVPTLPTGSRLPVLAALTCLAGFFAEPGYDCLAETLVLAPHQGTIATLAPTGFSLNADATELNRHFMLVLTEGTRTRLGDAVKDAMARYAANPSHFTPYGIYGVLGDPALLFSPRPSPPPGIASLRLAAGEPLSLTITGFVGQAYSLVATTNLSLPLAQWTPVYEGVLPSALTRVLDLGATNYPQRFYRLVRPQP